MRQHAEKGGEIIAQIEDLRYLSSIIRHHHERYDGTGYPDGLKAEAIPLPSRIITAADAYETMTTDRVYRGRLTLDAAVAELLANRGAQFDPVVVDTLVQMIEDGTVR